MSYSDFLSHQDAESLFAKLDYRLREGVHIQNNAKQGAYYHFIVANEGSLRAYYRQFFKLHLTDGGEQDDRYFYLEFNDGERGAVDYAHRHFLKPEHVITGLLLFKLALIDGHVELDTTQKFQTLLRTEYEEIRPHLNHLFAKLRTASSSQTADERIDAVLEETVKEFDKLGWILTFEDGTFEIQPSIYRLQKLYSDSINDLDTLIKRYAQTSPTQP